MAMQPIQHDLTSAAYDNFKKSQAIQPQYAQFNLTKPAYSVNEMLEMLPWGRTKLYELIKNGRLRVVKVGKKTLGLAPDIIKLLESLPEMNGGSHAAQ